MNVVAPFGFYGYGNIGDEATLQGFARLVDKQQHAATTWVASQSPGHTASVEPSFRYFRHRNGNASPWGRLIRALSEAYVFPGGTPIMDNLGAWPLSEVVPLIDHARRWEKPVVFVGAGVENLSQAASRSLIREFVADYVAHWSVRSPRDRERLLALGVPPDRITVAADLAWLLSPVTPEFGRAMLRQHGLDDCRLVGVNINAEHALLERQPDLFETLAALLDKLIDEQNVRVAFLCNEVREDEAFDKAAATAVRARMRNVERSIVLPNDYLTPQQMMSIISCCAMTISSRYHFCLFSALQDVPFLAIKRSDKVADLCEDLAWPFGASPGSINLNDISHQATALLNDNSSGFEKLPDRVYAMRERSWHNQKALDIMYERARSVSRARSLQAGVERFIRARVLEALHCAKGAAR